MPRGMEFDLIETVTVAVKHAQLRRESVGVETKLNGLRLAQCRAKCGQLVIRPDGAFTLNCVAKHNVAGKQIVRFKWGRLVLDFEHGLPSSFRSARARVRTRNPEAGPTSVSGFRVLPYRSRVYPRLVFPLPAAFAAPKSQPHRLWEQRHLLQSEGFRPSHDQVHILDRLTRGTLDQIVQGRNDDRAARDAIFGHADECHIGAPHMPRLWCLAEWQDMHKGLLQIEL